jgi:anti-sigma factor RsiW
MDVGAGARNRADGPDRRWRADASLRRSGPLADLHVANLAASSPVDVASSDRHTVKPWFQGKLPFSFNLPEVAGTPFTLVGGRLTYLDRRPGAHLVYDIGSHHISVFILRDEPELVRAFPVEQHSNNVLNFRVESWTSGGLRYFVVGEATEETIQSLIAMLRKAA